MATKREPRPVGWMGSSKEDLRALPAEVQDQIGFVLRHAQNGDTHPSMKQLSSGLFEIVCNFNKDTFRAVYVVKFEDAIFGCCTSFRRSRTRRVRSPNSTRIRSTAA